MMYNKDAPRDLYIGNWVNEGARFIDYFKFLVRENEYLRWMKK